MILIISLIIPLCALFGLFILFSSNNAQKKANKSSERAVQLEKPLSESSLEIPGLMELKTEAVPLMESKPEPPILKEPKPTSLRDTVWSSRESG